MKMHLSAIEDSSWGGIYYNKTWQYEATDQVHSRYSTDAMH